MENNSSSTASILTSLLGVALAASIIFGVWQYRKSGSLFSEKSTTELVADSLNTVSSTLQNNVAALESQLQEQNKAYEELQSQYEENSRLLAEKERIARNYRGELNSFKTRDKQKENRLTALNQEIAELRTLKTSMEERLKEIPELTSKLKTSDATIKEKYEELEALNTKYENLDKKYRDVVYYSPADNFKVEALKRNDKVTAKAKKSRTLRISFKLPAYLTAENTGTKPVYLTIVDANSKPISGVIENVNVMGPKAPVSLNVHAMQDVNFSGNVKEVVFTINMSDKVEPGNYTAQVYSANDYLGSVEFKLRDSFLFF